MWEYFGISTDSQSLRAALQVVSNGKEKQLRDRKKLTASIPQS
jgi:hypothetical protein